MKREKSKAGLQGLEYCAKEHAHQNTVEEVGWVEKKLSKKVMTNDS